MSRVGKQPIIIPSGVKAAIDGAKITVEGPKGKLTVEIPSGVAIVIESNRILVKPLLTGSDTPSEQASSEEDKAETFSPQVKANFGTARSVINNMILGVSKAWKRSLELNGVGFTAKIQGQILTLAVGYSHDVIFDLPKEIKCTVTKNVVDLESVDKQLVGNLAARIRKVQPPEPYLGKGIKYVEEKIRRKAGKTGKK